MDLEAVKAHVGDLPYMKISKAHKLEKILKKYRKKKLLELGFFHGVSSMYMAAILDDMGGGTLTTIDKTVARDKSPNIEQLAEELGLARYLEVFYEERSYLWRLMKFIEEGRRFDFCYIDGGHNWADTGFAFFLVDKLLEDGGLILFDDFNWTAEGRKWAADWPLEEQKLQPVERVWTLLVNEHKGYRPLWVHDRWALARKKRKVPLLPIRY